MAECKHQHILNVAYALKFQSDLTKKYWTDFITTIIYIISRNLTPNLDYKSPYELIYNKKPSYSHLKEFSCLCFASTLTHARTKFEPRACKCLIFDYPYSVKGYKLLDLNTNQIFISCDVIFHEAFFRLKATIFLNSPPTIPHIPTFDNTNEAPSKTSQPTPMRSLDFFNASPTQPITEAALNTNENLPSINDTLPNIQNARTTTNTDTT